MKKEPPAIFSEGIEATKNNKTHLSEKEKRQNKKLGILKWTLFIAMGAFIAVSLMLFFLNYILDKPVHNEYTLLVMVTVLGSTITTIIGILGGTSLE